MAPINATILTSWHHSRQAPQEVVSLSDLEDFGARRLRLLSQITQQTSTLHQCLRETDDRQQQLRRQWLGNLIAANTWLHDSHQDNVSHYALRLAFCTSEPDEMEWLVQSEAKLLALQWISAARHDPDGSELVQWLMDLAQVRYPYETTSERIVQAHAEVGTMAAKDKVRYLVPFQHASELVRQRQVIMRRGLCLVPPNQMIWVAMHHFRNQLRQAMNTLRRARPLQQREDLARLQPVVEELIALGRELNQQHQTRLAHKRKNPFSRVFVSLETIDSLAKRRLFPLCMQHLHDKLREHHHLKYDGRVQYRLFLKGLGLSVEQNLMFWRSEFTKKMSNQKFDKEYVYNIRHSYGLEGSRKDYSPQDCQQIRKHGAPRNGQYHGCPFRHWDSAFLHQELQTRGLSDNDTALHEVIALAQQSRPEDACRAYFRALHSCSQNVDLSRIGKHPIAWFEESAMLLE